MRITIDTSVFISRFKENDPHHAESRSFLEALPGKPVIVILPTLVGPEIAGAMRRVTGQTALSRDALLVLDSMPNLNLVTLDGRLAADAVDIAAETGMRGADAAFAATAQLFDAILVSLDNDHTARSPQDLRVSSPRKALMEVEAMG